jgi:hypothetical protein
VRRAGRQHLLGQAAERGAVALERGADLLADRGVADAERPVLEEEADVAGLVREARQLLLEQGAEAVGRVREACDVLGDVSIAVVASTRSRITPMSWSFCLK